MTRSDRSGSMPSLAFLVMLAALFDAGGARASSETGRVLRKEVVIAAPLDSIWNAWTTEAGLRFLSAKSHIDLSVGGAYEWFLDLEPDSNGRRGGEGARILAFRVGEMLSFDWTFPPAVPTLRTAGAKTKVVLLFDQVEDGVRIRFSQSGWQEGADWDAGYEYFDKAWSYVLQSMKDHLEAPPKTTPPGPPGQD